MLFTPQQISELTRIIDEFHILFIAEQVGSDVLSDNEKSILKKFGIDWKKLPKTGAVDDAFKFGILAEALGSDAVKGMTYDDFRKFLKSGKFPPLNQAEKLALEQLKFQTYNDIKGLGNRVVGDFNKIIVENDKKKRKTYEKIIKETTKEAIEKRQTAKELASELGHKTKDWARDFGRIADYVLHDAFDRGKAQHLLRKKGDNALVYKQVYAGACKSCIGLYLTGGIGSKPKLFKLSEIMGNGTNVGKKQKQWKPVLGPTHPWCRCELHEVPEGMEWDDKMQGFTQVVRDDKGVKRKSRAKITIKYGD